MAGTDHVEIYRDRRSEWRWRYRASNGRVIANSSEGYKRRDDLDVSLLLVFGSAMYTPRKGKMLYLRGEENQLPVEYLEP